jgi:hypothetical protein
MFSGRSPLTGSASDICLHGAPALRIPEIRMRPSLSAALFAALLASAGLASAAGAQVLDDTMVPRGRVRLQMNGTFDAWDRRFGRLPDGTERIEDLGEDLTDPTSLSLYPGMPALRNTVRGVTGLSGYEPILGSTDGRVTQDVTRIDFGAHVGVFDWLTVGVVVPWVRTRTAIDVFFVPDTVNGNLGLNPTITNGIGVAAFLGSTANADVLAAQYAANACVGGPSASCTAAQDLSARTTAFNGAMETAYGATPFFPLVGSEAASALAAEAAALSSELAAAGLTVLSPVALGDEILTAEGFPLLPSVAGSGIETTPLQTRGGIYNAGDVELSARVRLLDNLSPAWSSQVRYAGEERIPRPGLGYRVTASFMARLPTGIPIDPDILLDVGRADAQMDLEGGMTALLRFGRYFGLTAGGRYAIQGSTTVTRRVSEPELVMAPLWTRRQLTWKPGFYVSAGLAPALYLSDALVLHGEYRFFHKGRDEFELVTPDAALDPVVMEVESGVKLHQMGVGLRYDTVTPWLGGGRGHPMEVHLRLLRTFDGSGGHAPQVTRVEGGLRIFRRFWGPTR